MTEAVWSRRLSSGASRSMRAASTACTELRPGHRSLVDGELLVQGEVLEGELAVAAAEKGQEAKQLEQEGDHRTRIFSGSEPADQPLTAGPNFGDGQAGGGGAAGLVQRSATGAAADSRFQRGTLLCGLARVLSRRNEGQQGHLQRPPGGAWRASLQSLRCAE